MTAFTWWIDEPAIRGCSNPTDEELAWLRSEGFSLAVSLLEESEQPPRYDKQSALDAGWSINPIPIPENHAPSIEQIHEFMARLRGAPDDAKIVVFCESGKGRTACMGAAYWIAQGLQPDLAIERMSKWCLDSEWRTPERRKVLEEYGRIQARRKERL